jgi:hypothetical protein
MRADQTEVMSGYGSRRSSYYGGGGGGGHEQNRYSRASYYGHHQGGRESYDNVGGPVGGPPQRARYGNRMQSDPGWNNKQSMHHSGHNVYPINGLQQSRDTVNTNGSNGSHSDGPYSNEPGSDNSSFDRAVPVQRLQQPPQPDLGEQYGFNGFGKGPQMDVYNQGPSHGNAMYAPPQQNGAPPPPPKHMPQPAPIRLNSNGASPLSNAAPNVLSKTNNNDKRRSWFKRRFSKD